MSSTARVLIGLGVSFIVLGLAWQFLGKIQFGGFQFGRLPGDINIERPGSRVYIPITSCLIVSAVFSLISYLIRLFSK